MVSIKEHHKDILRHIKKTGYKLDAEETEKIWMDGNGRTIMLRGGQTIIRIEKVEPEIIAHEVFHAVEFLFNRINLKLTPESSEAYSYAIEYLMREIYKNIKTPKKL